MRTADLKRTFSKGNMTDWSYILYKSTEYDNDTKPNYRIDKLVERYSEPLLKKTELSIKENNNVWKELNII